ncbi:MGMT family protein [Cellulomonas carbonis]|uniref:Cysteine methyltransferase n=1 Tax=Cellulomonas carbonis T26 TaxID=947969 RepID=A0A0A0BXU5_9CELL|nr:MGMT family protein [Cellulomonas carbonis]KGM12009.1 cysteine methyltransferase [Cellulomonas carbonis T26]GGB98350.1 hypothetical protein GCM10010972_08950 [Cellulomonas carbonis]
MDRPGGDDEYVEAVLDLVEAIPPGRVMTYGTVAEEVAQRLGRGGPRQVGRVMATAGGSVPWWRVVNAAGRPPRGHPEAVPRLLAEGCPVRDAEDDPRVVLREAIWFPDELPGDPREVSAGRAGS